MQETMMSVSMMVRCLNLNISSYVFLSVVAKLHRQPVFVCLLCTNLVPKVQKNR